MMESESRKELNALIFFAKMREFFSDDALAELGSLAARGFTYQGILLEHRGLMNNDGNALSGALVFAEGKTRALTRKELGMLRDGTPLTLTVLETFANQLVQDAAEIESYVGMMRSIAADAMEVAQTLLASSKSETTTAEEKVHEQ